MISNDRTAFGRAMIANFFAPLGTATSAPATLDPDVAITARFPTTLIPGVTDALALVITIAPDPAIAVAYVAPFDPHEARAKFDRLDARRRRLFIDFDDGDRCRHVAVSLDHTTRGTDGSTDRGGCQQQTSKSVLDHRVPSREQT